jgi:hypothetical protein
MLCVQLWSRRAVASMFEGGLSNVPQNERTCMLALACSTQVIRVRRS